MEIEVDAPAASGSLVYPKHVHERPHAPADGQSGHQELAVPGPLRLADRVRSRPVARCSSPRGETGKVGDATVRFVGFDLQAEGNAMAQMAAGKPVTIGAEPGGHRQAGRPARQAALPPRTRRAARRSNPRPRLPGGGAILRRRHRRLARRRPARGRRRRHPGPALRGRHQQAADPARLGRPLHRAAGRRSWRPSSRLRRCGRASRNPEIIAKKA